jgi:hypothetical protein
MSLGAWEELFLEIKEDEKQHDRPTPFGHLQDDLPRLRTTGPKDNLFSKNWTARGGVQRVGASLFAALFLLSSVALFVGGVVVRVQISNVVDGIFGQALGTSVALLPFLMACALIFVAVRLIKGISRSIHR